MGRAAVHEVAARVGMDPREVASRLVALSATGLPLLVGVECDPVRLRQAAMAAAAPQYGMPQQPYGVQGTPTGPYPPSGPMQQMPGPYPQQPQPGPPGPPSGPHSVPPQQQQMMPRTGPPSAPFPAQTGPPSQPFPAPVQAQQVPQPMPQVEAPISTWGPPQTSTWARGDGPPQDVTQPTVRSEKPDVRQGKVGSALQTEGLEGERLSI